MNAPQPSKPTPSENLAEAIRAACLLEAAAPKAGNVHPGANFDDLTFADFVEAASLVAPILAQAEDLGVGAAILKAVEATCDRLDKNVNLGIVLLIAPLAAVDSARSLKDGIGDALRNLTQRDAEQAYHAIGIAKPGGMGQVDDQDVSRSPNVTLLEAMKLASARDTVALQFATDFDLVLNTAVPFLVENTSRESPPSGEAVTHLHLHLMSRSPDTLITRKRGPDIANESASRAQAVLESGWPTTDRGRAAFRELDTWLRADGNARNPGTTADLVAATLFAVFRDGLLPVPDPEVILKEARDLAFRKLQ